MTHYEKTYMVLFLYCYRFLRLRRYQGRHQRLWKSPCMVGRNSRFALHVPALYTQKGQNCRLPAHRIYGTVSALVLCNKNYFYISLFSKCCLCCVNDYIQSETMVQPPIKAPLYNSAHHLWSSCFRALSAVLSCALGTACGSFLCKPLSALV